MSGLARDAGREGRVILKWWHLALLAGLALPAVPGFARSVGLSERDFLIIGRAAVPLLAVIFVPGLILRDVTAGTLELASASAPGLGRIWATRLLVWLLWAVTALAVFVVPAELRVVTRYGLIRELLASVADLAIFAAASAVIAHRSGSETAGVVGGMFVWIGGVVLGLRPSGPEWVGQLTPLSAYFFGSPGGLWLNRFGWLTVALFFLVSERRRLDQPAVRFGQERVRGITGATG